MIEAESESISESWIRTAQLAGGTGTFKLDLASGLWEWTPQIAVLFGFDPAVARPNFEDWESAVFDEDVASLRAAIQVARTDGRFYVELRVLHPDGSLHWLSGRGMTAPDETGAARWLFGAYAEISDRKQLEIGLGRLNETLEARLIDLGEEARTLEILNRTGTALAAELDPEKLVQAVTDAGVELTEAQYGAFFYNVTNRRGEAYRLYTLSGADRAEFANFPMPRNTPLFETTFRGLGTVRSDDIQSDPRYARNRPHHGMPAGHLPVRSYLAVPVVSRSGEVLGGLFFGHAEPGIFTARTERILTGIAAQAAIAIDNARLHQANLREIEARRQTELELQRLNERLAERAEERTRQVIAQSAQLAESEDRFRLLVEAVVDYAIFMLDPGGTIVNWNPGAERIKGYRAGEIVGRHFSCFYTDEDQARELPRQMLEAAAAAGKHEAEGWRVRKDGSVFWASVVIDAIRTPAGELLGFAKITRDLTERRETDEQLRQAQKMEAIGQLTGGVAHDFNNLLTVIAGNVEMLLRRLPATAGSELLRPANAALFAANRAAMLTQRLLAFARRQALEPKAISINALIAGMSELLRRTLGEAIEVETVLAAGIWSSFVDANQLENAILNLAINARDAMPDGGKLTIESANTYLDEDYAARTDVPPGQYAGLFISDTGIGMSAEIISKAFDPFFTTKDVGHGTGLGLSQVYGFVKQSGGHIKIYSEVGQGTTIKLYLPRHHAAGTPAAASPAAVTVPRAREETILVVEDDPEVRAFSTEILRELGYRVVEAEDGAGALRLIDAHREIALLFTDVGLPGGMNGRQLADEARRRRAELKVLFTSGYARNAIVHHGRLDAGVELIGKPFTFSSLAAKIRRILDGV